MFVVRGRTHATALQLTSNTSVTRPSVRAISTTSAIRRGLRESEGSERSKQYRERPPSPVHANRGEVRLGRPSWREKIPPSAKGGQHASTPGKKTPSPPPKWPQGRHFGTDDDTNIGRFRPVKVTTAASEFIYGANSVLAALTAAKRKLYRLYLHEPPSGGQSRTDALTLMARRRSVHISRERDVQHLDVMSNQRPHNGVVLEASRLPALPVVALQRPDRAQARIPLELDQQSAETAAINGTSNTVATVQESWRRPFVLLLDGVLDPHNVGSIIRSAHFYGVDAVALASNTCAPLYSTGVAKASSGACEALNLLTVSKPSNFVYQSAKAGWHVYAAVAPGTRAPKPGVKRVTTSAVTTASPLAKHPVLLMLGAEGEGLRENLLCRASHFVAIENRPRARDLLDVGVDSLNVGVAAGVLIESFLSRPQSSGLHGSEGDLGF